LEFFKDLLRINKTGIIPVRFSHKIRIVIMEKVAVIEQTSAPAREKPQEKSPHLLDIYPYGWRYVRTVVNSVEKWKRVPLTRQELLHPELGDTKVHYEYHERFCTYLYDVLVAQLTDDRGAIVLHDVGVYWDDPDLDHHAPDIAVIFNVTEQRERRSFKVAEEGTKPRLIIEVTSLSNRSTDLVDKLDEYQQAGVPLYVIVDTYLYKGQMKRRLLGYELQGGKYRIMMPNAQERIWLEPVDLWIGLGDKVVLYDKSGTPIPNYTELTGKLEEAVTEAQVEAEARRVAEAKAKAEAEARRVAEAKAKAEAEAKAKMAVELAHLRAELARARGE
jgi:Uma2 family endonuclease